MGFYDRDYYRSPQSGLTLRAPQTIVGWLVLVNLVIWLVDGFTDGYWLASHMAVRVDTLTHPWYWWQYVTYAFAHAPTFEHLLGNMLTLFFLGRDIEAAYGRREFLRFYLVTAVVAAVVWNLLNLRGGQHVILFGASGAVTGVVILYALNFPHRTLLLFFVLPIPAWMLGAFVVILDMLGAAGRAGAGNVAYSVHLAGAAFALIYFQQRWNFTRLTDRATGWLRSLRRPKFRIHRPPETPNGLNEEVDRILEKIHREGEASLTAKERRTLETASREYRQQGAAGNERENP